MGREPNTIFDENIDIRDLEDIMEMQCVITENNLTNDIDKSEYHKNQNIGRHPYLRSLKQPYLFFGFGKTIQNDTGQQ